MERKKLIFLDIDGTLTVPGESQPPESALAAIRAAQARGHRVFLCTGRNRAMTAPLFSLGFDGAVCSAGGLILCDGEILYDHPLSAADRDTLLDALRACGVFTIVEARDAAYADGSFADFTAQVGPGNSEWERWRTALETGFGVLPMSAYRGEPIYKAIFACFDVHQVDPAKTRLADRFVCCIHELFSGVVNGEFICRDFNKGQAVRRLCAHLSVPVEDTVAFGDSMNDLEMIEAAGVGVCMGNGSAVLKERADMVCPPVAQDGLARAFGDLGLTPRFSA